MGFWTKLRTGDFDFLKRRKRKALYKSGTDTAFNTANDIIDGALLESREIISAAQLGKVRPGYVAAETKGYVYELGSPVKLSENARAALIDEIKKNTSLLGKTPEKKQDFMKALGEKLKKLNKEIIRRNVDLGNDTTEEFTRADEGGITTTTMSSESISPGGDSETGAGRDSSAAFKTLISDSVSKAAEITESREREEAIDKANAQIVKEAKAARKTKRMKRRGPTAEELDALDALLERSSRGMSADPGLHPPATPRSPSTTGKGRSGGMSAG